MHFKIYVFVTEKSLSGYLVCHMLDIKLTNSDFMQIKQVMKTLSLVKYVILIIDKENIC